MKKLRRIDIIVIVIGVTAPFSNVVIMFLYMAEILGHYPINPIEMFGFLQYAWPIIGAIALLLYFAALRYIIRPKTILIFVLLLLFAGGMSWSLSRLALSVA